MESYQEGTVERNNLLSNGEMIMLRHRRGRRRRMMPVS